MTDTELAAAMLPNSEILRGALSPIADDLVINLLIFIERAETSALHCRNVHEHILSAARGGNEAKPLVGLNHFTVPLPLSYLQ